MQTWLDFLGRLHPLLLHAPIGAIVVLALLELWLRRETRDELQDGTRRLLRFLAVLTALFASASAASGWFLSEDYGSAGTTFVRHRGFGIAFAVLTCLTAWLARARTRAYAAALASSLVLLLPTGHFGAEMTHGAGFLWAPFRKAQSPAPSKTPGATASASKEQPREEPPSDYERVIAPLLSATCTACHGETKQKGGLALHTPEALGAPGDSGRLPVVPGDALASELVRRLRLAPDHDDHMPPLSKPQPSGQDIAILELWIANGASFVEATDLALAPRDEPLEEAAPARSQAPALGDAGREAIAALREAQVHVETADPDLQTLWVDFRARPATEDAFARRHLAPLRDVVAELSLARTAVGDDTLSLVTTFPRLERLDLSGTACTTAGLNLLANHPTLRTLNVTGLALDRACLERLAAAPALETLFAWNTPLATDLELTTEDVGDLELVLGTQGPSAPLSLDDAPLLPHNLLCPVKGTPLGQGPSVRIVHRDKVVGLCCTDCALRFWEAPDQYASD